MPLIMVVSKDTPKKTTLVIGKRNLTVVGALTDKAIAAEALGNMLEAAKLELAAANRRLDFVESAVDLFKAEEYSIIDMSKSRSL